MVLSVRGYGSVLTVTTGALADGAQAGAGLRVLEPCLVPLSGKLLTNAMNNPLLAFCVLSGELDKDFWLQETDLDWWAVCLWIHRN